MLTEYGALAGSQFATHGLCFSSESADCVSTLESVRGKYGSLSTELPDVQPAAKLRDDVDQELEHVSFTFDTIKLCSLIVCGLLALPHDLVPNQTQVDVCCVCIVEAANPCVLLTIPEVHRCFSPEMAFSSAWFNP